MEVHIDEIYLRFKNILSGCRTIYDALYFAKYIISKYPESVKLINGMIHNKTYDKILDYRTIINTLKILDKFNSRQEINDYIEKNIKNDYDYVQLNALMRVGYNKKLLKDDNFKEKMYKISNIYINKNNTNNADNADNADNAVGSSNEIISTNKEKMKKSDKSIEDGIFKADIKITKNIKTGVIVSEAYISDGTYKLWKYQKNNCKDKNKEIINIIIKIINYDKNKKYTITVNNKKFITDYNTAVVYYKDKEKSKETNILDDIFNNQNIGELKIINNIRIFKDIIAEYKQFSFVSK